MTDPTDQKHVQPLLDRISDYSPGRDYQPCTITFHMRTPVCLGHPWINFDSLCAYACLTEVLGEDLRKLPNKTDINTYNLLELPLAKTNETYHSSISFFDTDDLNVKTIYKRFETTYLHHLTKKKRTGKIRQGSGAFRNFMLRVPYIPTRTVTFHVCGDIETIGEVISNISSLGLKRAEGNGIVNSVSIEEEDRDRSIIFEGNAMRPLPCRLWGPGHKNVMLAWKLPYWLKTNVEMCIYPGSIVGIGG
ncbi:MAG: hypothetical protein DDT40_00866 [candidate division WS2 bacterium]|nr:hypothetical protein [Candidatus Psychracetigena formicireducens]